MRAIAAAQEEAAAAGVDLSRHALVHESVTPPHHVSLCCLTALGPSRKKVFAAPEDAARHLTTMIASALADGHVDYDAQRKVVGQLRNLWEAMENAVAEGARGRAPSPPRAVVGEGPRGSGETSDNVGVKPPESAWPQEF